MNSQTITVIIKGFAYYFHGDELTSPEQQAILFLRDQEKDSFDE